MKIIHTADIHLDSKLTANLTGDKKTQRKNELLLAFKSMVEYAVRNSVSAIIIAGDFFDSKTVTQKTKNVVFKLIENTKNIDFLYLCGNHDENLSVLNGETLPPNLKVFKDKVTTFEYDVATISGIELNEKNYLSFYEDIKLPENKTNIFVLHGEIGKPSANNYEIIDLKRLYNKNITYLALGHYHSFQIRPLDKYGVYVYSGCLEGRGFDETGTKGFMLLESDGKKLESKFVKNSIRTLHEIVVDITNKTSYSEQEKAIREALSEVDKKDLVKIVLTGTFNDIVKVDVKYLTALFEREYFFVKIYNQTKLSVDLNKVANDKSLKGEFIRQVLINASLSDQLKDEIITTGLSVLQGEDLD